MASSIAIHRCLICGSKFSRREHLKRHIRSHTREKPFQCPTCGKCFARSDILARHHTSHEQDIAPPPLAGTFARACCQCATTRVRCTRGYPCQRCQLRNLVCLYPDKRRTPLPSVIPTETGSTEMPTGPSDRPLFGPSTASVPESAPTPPADLQWVAPAWESQLADPYGSCATGTLNTPFFLDAVGPGGDGSIWGDMSWSAPCPQPDTANLTVAEPVSSASVQSEQTPPSTDSRTTMDAVSFPHSVTSVSTTGRYYVDGGGARAPFNGQLLRHHGRRRASASTGPDVPHVGPGDSDLLLDDPCTPGEDVTLVSEGTYTQMINNLRSASCSSTELSLETVRTYVAAYFENFHPTFPFLRWHSFAEESNGGWMLLLAVTITGSKFVGRRSDVDHQLQRKAMLEALEGNLSRTNGRSHLWVPEQDEETLLPSISLSRLQAQILWVVCLAHTGQTEDLQRALLGRHRLVEACDRMGLLKGRQEMSTDDWRAKECRVRTGMMIWLLDTLLSYMFGCRALMHLDDIQAPLPCHNGIWETSESDRPAPASPLLLHALDMLYIERRLPTHLGEFSALILIYAICRQTTEAVARGCSRLSSWVPGSLEALRKEDCFDARTCWRNSAHDCLDMLHWRANGQAARAAGWEHPTILHLHLARLLLGEATAETATSVPCNPFWTRLGVIHAGALLWHVRRFSSGSFVEPFAVHLATVVVCRGASQPAAGRCVGDTIPPPDPPLLYLDRPLDDELVQTYVRLGDHMTACMLHVGDIRAPGAPDKMLREGIRILGEGDGQGEGGEDQDGSTPSWGIEQSYASSLWQRMKEESRQVTTTNTY